MKRVRIVSGMRPTGPLHLGHLHGVLDIWKKLQEEYECFYFIADWHALTTEYEDPSRIRDYTKEIMLDWLAVGLDPDKATIFLQSEVKEHAELYLLLGMITPVSWLERNPTYKDMLQNLTGKDLAMYGFLGYPVLQSADILIYRAHKVPVGLDQVPHLELTREIARRFNYLYGNNFFPEPEALLSESAKVLGIDGRKMSKSYDNAIFLKDSPEEIRKKVLAYVTDTLRPKKSDPGDPENRCVAFNLMKLYYNEEEKKTIIEDCKKAILGCVECKKRLADRILRFLEPIQTIRASLQKKGKWVEILREGTMKARKEAAMTMDEIRKVVFKREIL
ncbi:MAG: tryptophan--tRNA ligase [Caldimicrobium sp.]|nr:tryptophan--tRNA ligase [Caldimicrobium sp.]MCX7874411.1 tryptophan--tRNA ligase [Caldimicrobium sp.]MDW8094004.1 tryptophan--tRNA ligase [Caldimicrobium sp.]